jgi:hypothetical protein
MEKKPSFYQRHRQKLTAGFAGFAGAAGATAGIIAIGINESKKIISKMTFVDLTLYIHNNESKNDWASKYLVKFAKSKLSTSTWFGFGKRRKSRKSTKKSRPRRRKYRRSRR